MADTPQRALLLASHEDEKAHLDRLKKLSAELDAAQGAATDTLKHVVGAKHQTDKLITHNTRFIDTSSCRPPKPPKRRKRKKDR